MTADFILVLPLDLARSTGLNADDRVTIVAQTPHSRRWMANEMSCIVTASPRWMRVEAQIEASSLARVLARMTSAGFTCATSGARS